MKHFLLIISLLFYLSSLAQEYAEVVQVEGKSSTELYSLGKQWFVNTFNSANAVLQMDNPELGKLIGKGITNIYDAYQTGGIGNIPVSVNYKLSYTVNLSVKEGRYKYSIENITMNNGYGESAFEDYKKQLPHLMEGSTEEGAKKHAEATGQRCNKSTARIYARTNASTVKCIKQAELEIGLLIESLKNSMLQVEDNW